MFMIRKKAKNSSAPRSSNSTPSPPTMNSPPKPSKSSNRLSRFPNPTADPTMPSSSPDLSGYQSNPEDNKSYQSFSYSVPPTRSPPPLITSPVAGVSQLARTGLRKSRQAPTFNLMVIGASMTGKSTFLHTLMGSLNPSLPTQNDLPPVSIPPTSGLSETRASIVTLSGEKVTLNVIDTPGLDIQSNDEFRVDLQSNEYLRYIESKFDDSLHIERQVHRNPTRLGDRHVHVAIYFIDPSSIVRRRPATLSVSSHRDLNVTTSEATELHMSAIDLRQLRRLSRRCNVVPVIARADELTEAALAIVKAVVRSDIKQYGIDLGLFEANESESTDEDKSSDHLVVTTASSNSVQSNDDHNGDQKKLPRRKSVALLPPRRPFSSVINSLQEFENVGAMIPFSVVGAEVLPGQSMTGDDIQRLNQADPLFDPPNSEQPPSIYIRRFKWAIVDILNPGHCDFVLLRAVVLGSHFKKLVEATRLDKYEKYRTEKLLARRRTMNKGPIGLEEQKKIAEEVEKMEIPHIEPTVSIFVPPAPPKTTSSGFNLRLSRGGRQKQSTPSQPIHRPANNLYQSANTSTNSDKYHPSHADNLNNIPMVF